MLKIQKSESGKPAEILLSIKEQQRVETKKNFSPLSEISNLFQSNTRYQKWQRTKRRLRILKQMNPSWNNKWDFKTGI